MPSNGGFIKKLCERNALNFETQVLPASYASVSTDLCRLDVQLQAVVTFAWKSIQAPLPHFLILQEVLLSSLLAPTHYQYELSTVE